MGTPALVVSLANTPYGCLVDHCGGDQDGRVHKTVFSEKPQTSLIISFDHVY